jgi:hypothetical protein
MIPKLFLSERMNERQKQAPEFLHAPGSGDAHSGDQAFLPEAMKPGNDCPTTLGRISRRILFKGQD